MPPMRASRRSIGDLASIIFIMVFCMSCMPDWDFACAAANASHTDCWAAVMPSSALMVSAVFWPPIMGQLFMPIMPSPIILPIIPLPVLPMPWAGAASLGCGAGSAAFGGAGPGAFGGRLR